MESRDQFASLSRWLFISLVLSLLILPPAPLSSQEPTRERSGRLTAAETRGVLSWMEPELIRSETLSWDGWAAQAIATDRGSVFAWTEGYEFDSFIHLERLEHFQRTMSVVTDLACTRAFDLAWHDGTLLIACAQFDQLKVAVFDEQLSQKAPALVLSEGTNGATAAWHDESFLVLHSSGETLVSARVSTEGHLLRTSEPFVEPMDPPEGTRAAQQYPRIVQLSDDELFIIWQEGAAYTGTCSLTCPIPPRDGIIRFGHWRHGQWRDGTPQTIDPEAWLFAPVAAFNGEQILLGWFQQHSGTDVELNILEDDGSLRHVATFANEMPATFPQATIDLAALGEQFQVVWEAAEIRESDGVLLLWSRNLRGTTITDGEIGPVLDFVRTRDNEWSPSIHPTDTGFQLMFVHDTGGADRIVRQTWRIDEPLPRRRSVGR